MVNSRVHGLLQSFSQKKILLIGDTIVDHSIYGTLLGTSAETPTIVAREKEARFSLGGAFLVCRNLLALGASVTFCTLLGNDPDAAHIYAFTHPRLQLLPLLEKGRKTTVKRRYWVDGYKLLQFDQLDNRPLSETAVEEVLAALKEGFDALVLSDYRHGLLTATLIERVLAWAREKGLPTYVDSQVAQSMPNHHHYRGATTLCLNKKEALSLHPTLSFPANATQLRSLRSTLAVDNIVLKKGEEGVEALVHDAYCHCEALQVKAVDPCGAGDAFLAALVVSGLSDPALCLKLANIWAGLSTTTTGPEPPEFRDFLAVVQESMS